MNSIIVNILKDPKTCEMIDSGKIEDVVQLIEPHGSESDKEELYDIFSSCGLSTYMLIPQGVKKDLIHGSLRLQNYEIKNLENEIHIIWRFYSTVEEKDPEVIQFKNNLRDWIRSKFPEIRNVKLTHSKTSKWDTRFRQTVRRDVIKLTFDK